MGALPGGGAPGAPCPVPRYGAEVLAPRRGTPY